jgi:hypothetical protein
MNQLSGATDFDFLLGAWSIRNRRRRATSLLAEKGGDWEEFPATHTGTKALDGKVTIEHYEATFPNGQLVKGLTIRAFDAATQQWAIVWLDNRQPPDFAPLLGRFKDGVGEFYQAITTPDGKPLHVRFTWDHITEETARWQQAFSYDAGLTWDTNWVMEFSRQR